MVRWEKPEGKVRRIHSTSVDPEAILSAPWYAETGMARIPAGDFSLDFNVQKLVGILGDFWKVMHREKDYDAIRSAIRKYWAYQGKPTIQAEYLETTADETVFLRCKILKTEADVKKSMDLNKVMEDVNDSFDYDRIVVGSDDMHLELQLLVQEHRREVEKGDFLDAGLFLSVDQGIKVAAGVHRLVCTNGLTEPMMLWRGSDYRFGADGEYIRRATDLAGWLASQHDKKVNSVRELSVALKDYSKPLMNRFWKYWSEQIDLGKLTWYAVINDMTQSVNSTLSSTRYNVLNVPAQVKRHEEEHRCPTCSAQV